MVAPSPYRTANIDCVKSGMTNSEIVKKLKVSRVLVFRTAQRYRRLGTSDDMQRRGLPVTVTTPEAVKADKLKMIPYRMQKGAFLNQKNKTFRMKKARKLLAGTKDGSHLTTLFTDEKVFTQDGAPAHRAKGTQECCRANFSEFISAADWPASSPDLNPMDYAVWIYLTEKVSSKNYPSIKALKTALIKKWDEIDDDYLRAVIDAYPKRLKAVIKAKGGRFENYF
ncbi:unnamed protein product [Caenorhabditis auriculariae]|uniref:Tc1-like transposase DDE domain-containing protein n=1 Tax=Caenorhabditis auriculariae TaxID=2777116 RepID=A0A8S1HVJ4_9PELO|nr:unnamed protein product [Caenorhabditis auriculariae]